MGTISKGTAKVRTFFECASVCRDFFREKSQFAVVVERIIVVVAYYQVVEDTHVE